MSRTHSRRRNRQQENEEQAKKPVIPPGLPGGQYKPLTDEGVRRIHEASLEVLARVGIEVQPSECREIFRAAGARIDEATRTKIGKAVFSVLATNPNSIWQGGCTRGCQLPLICAFHPIALLMSKRC
jgi:trimethylamine:corrinoid methyltransferase-like protein